VIAKPEKEPTVSRPGLANINNFSLRSKKNIDSDLLSEVDNNWLAILQPVPKKLTGYPLPSPIHQISAPKMTEVSDCEHKTLL
jgi:hypothetical protein